MTERKPKSDLIYGMRPNPRARQPSGLTPDVVEFLKGEGGIADDPPPPPTSVQSPVDAADPELVVVAANTLTPPEAGPRLATKKRSRSRKADTYGLPPARKRQPSRSNHFRLPADVEEHLKELAKIYECSRTHVVCSVISSEWQRLKRRESRPAKSATAAS